MRKLLLVVAALLLGCGSDTTMVNYPDVTEDAPWPDTTPPADNKPADVPADQPAIDIAYPDLGVLEYFAAYDDDNKQCKGYSDPPANTQKITTCHFKMGYNTDRLFKVIYLEDGKPVMSQEVSWELIHAEDPGTGDPIVSLDTKSSGTDAEGVATVKATTKNLMGQFQIKATAVTNKFQIPPLYFDVVITPKSTGAPLTVKFKHEGKAPYDVVKAYLFLQAQDGKPLCEGMDPQHLPPADKASPELNSVTQSAQFNNFPDLTPQHPLMYTVVGVTSKVGGPVTAFGCDGENGWVKFGESNEVLIILTDVPPKYKGKYEVINHFDMISALPDDIEKVVNIVIDFFNNPTAGLMEFTCQLGDNDTLKTLCEYFFNDPDNPSIDDLTGTGEIVSEVINAILYGLLKDNVGSDILFTGKDVGNILRDLEIHSTITLKAEPDATGFIPKEQTEEEWHTVSFQWTLGEDCNPIDPQCGLKSYSFNAIGQDVVIGHFDAHLEGFTEGTFDQLVIDPHSLNFKYGAFLNFVIEKLVLPMVAGDGSDGLPVVDSYEKFFGALLGGKECLKLNNCCDVFAKAIADQAGSWIEATVAAGCEALIPLGASYLRNFLLSLDADTGDTFTIATKAGIPCTLYDDDGDAEIDTWGKMEPPELRCLWDVQLKLADIIALFDAEFWGTREQ